MPVALRTALDSLVMKRDISWQKQEYCLHHRRQWDKWVTEVLRTMAICPIQENWPSLASAL